MLMQSTENSQIMYHNIVILYKFAHTVRYMSHIQCVQFDWLLIKQQLFNKSIYNTAGKHSHML